MKKKIALGVLGVLGLLIGGLLVAAALQPDSFAVERSRTLSATPAQIHPSLDDLRKWGEWNPWLELDPAAELTYSDPASGEGAWYEWSGNDDVGKGKMTITSSSASRVAYDLEFIEPFASTADVEILLEPQGEGTRVTWRMSGDNDFAGKMFGLFYDMDSAIGADFERGLEKLARHVVARTAETGAGG